MIEIVTFTGVDERTDLQRLTDIAERYPWTEFGVLIGSHSGLNNPIFPSLVIVDEFNAVLNANHKAIHLCGVYARQAMSENMSRSEMNVTHGFGRIQVNLHGDEYNPTRVAASADLILGFAGRHGGRKVIMQHRGGWDTVPVHHPDVEYLFDLSEGGGQEGFAHWPEPPDHMRVGYAGGIGPHNIDQAISFAERHRGRPIWIDMERNVRTDDYWFDLDRVEAVCRQVAAADIAV